MNRPIISVVRPHPRTLADTTWEERRQMTAAELILLMGPLHVEHPQFRAKPRTLLPMPNLAGIQPVISRYDARIRGHIAAIIGWAMR